MSSSRRARPGRRRWRWAAVAAVASAVAPGVGQAIVASHRRASARCALASSVLSSAAVLAAAVAASADPSWLPRVVESPTALDAAVVACVAAAALRVWSALDAAWSARPELTWWFGRERAAFGALCAAAATVAVVPAATAGWYLHAADRAASEVFAVAEPVVAEPGGTSRRLRPRDPWAGLDRLNVLLLGADAGPGRVGLRTDSIVVLSVDPRTGDAALVSVPRNLQRAPSPPGSPLAERYPAGFPDSINALYRAVADDPDLAAAPLVADPAAHALKESVAELLGVDLHYHVLVDMAGFVDIVDALGGVRVVVPEAVPTPGNPPDAKRPVPPVIDAGEHHMDGTLALAYARSRSADSDYQRMGRQRCLLSALAADADPATLARVFPQVASALSATVSTDIPRERLSDLVELATLARARVAETPVRSLSLTPPLVAPSRWEPAAVRALVEETLAPPAPSPATTDAASVPPDGTTPPDPGASEGDAEVTAPPPPAPAAAC